MDRRTKGMNLELLVAVYCMLSTTYAYECSKSAKVCETWLEVDHFLTMTHPEHRAVKVVDGKLYKKDVGNITLAETIPVEEVITVDGETQRLVIVANGTMPGPPIIVYEGQTVLVHVINRMFSESITLHWHGIHQRGTPYSDGPSYITQCPIQPLQRFTYKFVASPAGTHWYHSHVGFQRTNGLFGALIVRKKNKVYSNEKILQIQDWNHEWTSERGYLNDVYGLEDKLYSISGEEFPPVLATSGLINGKGRFYKNIGEHNGAPLEVFQVAQNETYTFRIINTGGNFPFRVSVDDHELTVIASDGHDLLPVKAESVVVFPGERFDVTITTDKNVDNYWIRGITLESEPHIVDAILRYENAPMEDPKTDRKNCTTNSMCVVVNCMFKMYPKNENIECILFGQMKSDVGSEPAPVASNDNFEEHFLNFAVPGEDEPHTVNGIEFQFPNVNALSQFNQITTGCENQNCGEQKICSCTSSVSLNKDNTIQLVLLNMGSGALGAHPIHLHGHSFHVVKMVYADLDETTGHIPNPDEQNTDIDCRGGTNRGNSYCNKAAWSNNTWSNGNIPGLELSNPPIKDTIIVPSGGYVVVRFKADNPGMWLIHCHIEVHGATGMSMILNESFPHIPNPPKDFPTCQAFTQSADVVSETVQPESTTITYQKTTKTDMHKEDDDDDDDDYHVRRDTFLIVTFVLTGIVLAQLIIIVIFYLKKNSSSSKALKLNDVTNAAYVSN